MLRIHMVDGRVPVVGGGGTSLYTLHNVYVCAVPKGMFFKSFTVEILLSGHLLSGHPLLSGQLSKFRIYCQYNQL